jgi:hypothetical protein
LYNFFYSYKIENIISNTPDTTKLDVNFKSNNIDDILKYSIKYTTNQLTFNLHSKNSYDINFIKTNKSANCVGYVTYYNNVLYNLLQQNNINYETIQHARAEILIGNYNIHNLLTNPSLKNHDISIITINNKTYYIDPSLSELGLSIIVTN